MRNIAAGRQKCTRCPNATGFQQIRPENICRQKMGEYDWRLHGDVEGCRVWDLMCILTNILHFSIMLTCHKLHDAHCILTMSS